MGQVTLCRFQKCKYLLQFAIPSLCTICLNMMRGLYVFIVVTLLLVYCYSFIEFKLIFQNPGILLILN